MKITTIYAAKILGYICLLYTSVSNVFSNVGINLNGFFDQLPDDAQTSTNFEKDSNGIKRISLQFVEERVEVVLSDDAMIRAEQTSNKQLDEEDIMHYGTKNGELLVQSGRVKRTIFTDWGKSKDIKVTLYIPKDYAGTLEVSTVSGSITSRGVGAKRGVFDTTVSYTHLDVYKRQAQDHNEKRIAARRSKVI